MTVFGPWLASNGTVAVRGDGQVYALSQAGVYSVPKAVTDLLGNPMPVVRSDKDGLIERFMTGDNERAVLWKSGDFVTEIISASGVAEDLALFRQQVDEAVQAAQSAADDAAAAGGGVPDGGTAGQIIVKTGPGDGEAQWQDPATTSLPSGYPATWPTAFPPSSHSHAVSDLRRVVASTLVALSSDVLLFLAAGDKQAARAAIGAGTGDGTSNLTIGTTPGTAAAGNHTHTDYITAAQLADALSGIDAGGSGKLFVWKHTSGAYPAIPADVTTANGFLAILALGPVQPTSGWPSDIMVLYGKPKTV